jgi:8-hydroxy-5-deazaflavin:NADPH oxidoreductase
VKIGIIGTGNMGTALGRGLAGTGHQVMFGSRDPDKARTVAASIGGSALSGDFDAAAAFGEVVVYTVRGVFPSAVLREPRALAGKSVIDVNNRDVGDDSRPAEFRFDTAPPIPSLSQQLAADVPGARVVKAFNTIPMPVLELARLHQLAPHRVSVFLASDDHAAKAIVKDLVEELGFVGVDSGALANAWLLDGLADFLRLQIGHMGRGGFTTLSLNQVSES